MEMVNDGPAPNAQMVDAADLAGQSLVKLPAGALQKLGQLARARGIEPGQALLEAISLELAALEESNQSNPKLFVKRPDGATVELVAR